MSEQDARVFKEDADMIYYYKGTEIKVLSGSSYNLKAMPTHNRYTGEKV